MWSIYQRNKPGAGVIEPAGLFTPEYVQGDIIVALHYPVLLEEWSHFIQQCPYVDIPDFDIHPG